MSHINKKTIEDLANLAKIELHESEKEKLVHDLENILGHFEELKAVNTDGVQPLIGGTSERNVLRTDEARERPLEADSGALVEMFPAREGSHLKVPPVFE